MNAPRDHDTPFNIRCIDCHDCNHCSGIGIVEKGSITNTALNVATLEVSVDYPSSFPTFSNLFTIESSSLSPAHFPSNIEHLHPHIQGILSTVILERFAFMSSPKPLNSGQFEKENIPIIKNTNKTPKSTTLQSTLLIESEIDHDDDCPKCSGKGFSHESTKKHDNKQPNLKCKHCTLCKICHGSGKLENKVVCKKCNSKSIFHL